jgi:hypothetical protein
MPCPRRQVIWKGEKLKIVGAVHVDLGHYKRRAVKKRNKVARNIYDDARQSGTLSTTINLATVVKVYLSGPQQQLGLWKIDFLGPLITSELWNE